MGYVIVSSLEIEVLIVARDSHVANIHEIGDPLLLLGVVKKLVLMVEFTYFDFFNGYFTEIKPKMGQLEGVMRAVKQRMVSFTRCRDFRTNGTPPTPQVDAGKVPWLDLFTHLPIVTRVGHVTGSK
jgi:hypothetical protein